MNRIIQFLIDIVANSGKKRPPKPFRLEEELPKQFGTNEKCPKCSLELIFDHTSDGGTRIEVYADRFHNPRRISQRIIRNAKMPFLWVYFKCPKCDWILCTTSKSKDIFIVKSDKQEEKKE